MTDRKEELAKMCRVEIRKTSAISKSLLADYGYHLVESIVDAEIEAMLERLTDKPVQSDDVPMLRDLVIADLWPRLREAHKEHRVHLFQSLKLMHMESVSPHASFALDIGWAMLIQAAADRVETYPAAWKVTITGGKEKLGCCVIHIDYDGSQRGARSEVERLREEVRLRSLATCDICGGQGRLRLGGYAKTVCDKHAAIFEGFREDDGMWADPWKWSEQRPIGEYIDDVAEKARAIMSAASAETDERNN